MIISKHQARKLLNLISSKSGNITSAELNNMGFYLKRNKGFGSWIEWANAHEINILRRTKYPKGYMLEFSVKDIREKIYNLCILETKGSVAVTPKTFTVEYVTEKQTDSLLRDFNATVDSLYNEQLHNHEVLSEKMDTLMNAFKILLKRQDVILNNQDIMLDRINDDLT